MRATLKTSSACAFFLIPGLALGASPRYLEDRFEIPAGFRVYRAAAAELCGGSYDIALDGEGRLLVGDGTQVRRLTDRDGDAIFDAGEVVATGLGPRGPQGLLVLGDRLYAVGGDGLQLFEGYRSGKPLVHRGRLGERFGTGGDHDAHQVIRGHEGYLYFICGDGSGTRDRRHITESTSPVLFERSCSVFRVSPDGKRWECVGSGGRNSPNIGVNYLAELFSFDSDMEWHVELPWWRPVRLHHWAAGGDQGWQDVGAYPPYYLDNLPGVVNVGRGSPDWGVFYEHRQLPEKYRDAYLCCDYLSKSATTGGYETSGRLYSFFLEREGAGWKGSYEVLAKPKPGARDEAGQALGFALVDIEVAPDGSLLLSDHNQGVWRIFYDPAPASPASPPPPLVPAWAPLPRDKDALLGLLLALPQPGSEWSRLREEEILKALGSEAEPRLKEVALAARRDLRVRLRALRLLSPGFAELPQKFLESIATDRAPELRGQAAWLLGLRGGGAASSLLLSLIDDEDPFVRRRVVEALGRSAVSESVPRLIDRLADPVRLVRYSAMTALAHYPSASWFDRASTRGEVQVRMRALAAAHLRREPPADDVARRVVIGLLDRGSPGDSKEDRLDLLRILGLYQRPLKERRDAAERVHAYLLAGFPDADSDIRREQARLLGEYRVPQSFGKLATQLESERDPIEQFHLAQALARLPEGFSAEEEDRALNWFLASQNGWFAQFAGKGLEFPHFWATVLSEFSSHHGPALSRRLSEIDLSSLLGAQAIVLMADPDAPAEPLLAIYRANSDGEVRKRILGALGRLKDPAASRFIREEYLRLNDQNVRGICLRSLAAGAVDADKLPFLEEGLLHEEREVARACASALARAPRDGAAGEHLKSERLAKIVLARLLERPDLFHALEKILAAAAGAPRPGQDPDAEGGRRPEEPARQSAIAFWKKWYADRFGHAFEPGQSDAPAEKPDDEVRKLLLSDSARGGDAARGRKVYEAARCAPCHGGLGKPDERIFGPDLAGVTRRLNREEIADSLVFPSKLVSDRFKAKVVLMRGASPLTGFITEESDEAVTLVDQDGVHRIPRAKVQGIALQEASLMPERLLNRLSVEEIKDLLAFLEEVGARPDPRPAGAGAK